MITKQSTHSIKFANTAKKALVGQIYFDVQDCVQIYLAMIHQGKLPNKPKLSSKELPIVNQVVHSAWRQVCYSTASGIYKSKTKCLKDHIYARYKRVYKYFANKGRMVKFTSKRFKELDINLTKRLDLKTGLATINLDYHLFNIQMNQTKAFDCYVRITSPYKPASGVKFDTIKLPIKYHKHNNELMAKGYTRNNGCCQLLTKTGQLMVGFIYSRPETATRLEGDVIGLDQGYNKLVSDSNGNHYGSHLKAIYAKLAQKQRGSKNYNQYLQYKKDEINRVAKSIQLDSVATVYIEDLVQVKHKSKLNRKLNNKMQYWSYNQLVGVLANRSKEEGFQLERVDPRYTSQICSVCLTHDKKARQGETYHCQQCGAVLDSDTNGARMVLIRGVYGPSIPLTKDFTGP